jgi:spore germination protein GerM
MRPPRRILAALVAGLTLVGAGCGLSPNESPEAIAPENLPPGLLDPNPATSTPGESPGSTSVAVFFLERVGETTRLVEVEREVADSTSASERVGALLTQPTADETEAGITTAIPADLILVEEPVLDEDSGVLTVDLSDELNLLQGAELSRAVAQIVYTATAVEGVAAVRFVVEGEAIPVPDDEGVAQEAPVDRSDYRSLRPDT